MTQQSKTREAALAEGPAKLELSTLLSVEADEAALQGEAEEKNLCKSVFTDKPKEDLKYSKKSIYHRKKLQSLVAIASTIIVGANNLVQLWQNLDMSNRIGAVVNHLPHMEEVRKKSSNTN
jgi:hypothetical protein